MIDNDSLGKRIKEKRKAMGLTREQLGSSIGVTARTVSAWENGESAPDPGIVPDLCRVLELTHGGLLGMADRPPMEEPAVEAVPDGLKCAFCGKGRSEVVKLIAGPGVCICNECVTQCNRMLKG